jgi:hypothetical protein
MKRLGRRLQQRDAPSTRGALARLLHAHPVASLIAGTTGAALVAALVGAAVGQALAGSASSGQRGRAPQAPRRPALASGRVDLGGLWGRVFAGRASAYESLGTAEAQADDVPANASVSKRANTIRVAGRTVALTIVANPPSGRDMAFRVAGLENPTIEVSRGAEVKIRFVNADSDSAHGWLLLDPVVQIGKTVHGPRAFAGAYAPMLGDPMPAGQPIEMISFHATRPGSYRYECPVPGHAAMGMQGAFVVSG